MQLFHSVILDEEKCRGCTNCIQRCPTEAIRVRDGKARILEFRCIDCGECIRACAHKAKMALTDELTSLQDFDYRIALPAPTLYGQFPTEIKPGIIHGALKALGFDEIHDVARGADFCTLAIADYLSKQPPSQPVINSACPAVIRLIQVLFPDLLDLILPLEAPAEIMARKARAAIEKREPGSKVGTFFITPCPAKVTAHRSPEGNPFSHVDRNIAISTIYGPLLTAIKNGAAEEEILASGAGFGWARAGGENQALGRKKHLSVDGIHEVLAILEELEMENLPPVDFIELLACAQGCVGGPLTVVNKFICRNRIRTLMEEDSRTAKDRVQLEEFKEDLAKGHFAMSRTLKPRPLIRYDLDIQKAMLKMEEARKVEETLPGLDCGACGAPTCHSLAEDIANGQSTITDCVFKLREELKEMADHLHTLARRLYPAEPLPDDIENSE